MKKYYSFLTEDRMSDLKAGNINGGIVGGVLGLTAGNILANHLGKRKEIN